MATIGLADTNFARIDMAAFALSVLQKSGHKIARYTVPGMKDLPAAAAILFDKHNCDLVMVMGMAGPMPIDKQCSHEASLGIQFCQVTNKKHILEVFVHADESDDSEELITIAKNRTEKHAENALALLKGKEALTKFAGQGKRQGKKDAGPLKIH